MNNTNSLKMKIREVLYVKKNYINILNEQAEISYSKLTNTCLLKMTNTTC